jgi:uncharacterized protein
VIDTSTVEEFLAHRRLAVVGVSDQRGSFARTVYQQLRDHGYEVAAVHPSAVTVADDPCYPDLASVPGELDGVIVMVNPGVAADVVRDAAALGIPRVWLFKGLGGPGAVSDEAVELCQQHGIAVVPGACPMMFLEPVGWFHRLHRGMRRRNGSLARTG